MAAALWQYCFADPPEFTDWYFARRAGDILAVTEGETLIAQTVCVPVSVNLCGMPRAGMILSGVATAPSYRRQGRMTAFMRDGLAHMREKGINVAALYPFDYGFYRHYGFAACGEIARVKTLLRDLPSVKPRGEIMLTADCAALARAYEASFSRYNGHILRNETAFALRLEELALDSGYSAVYRRDGREAGYLLYHMADKTLVVDEIGAADDVARLDIFGFLGNHASTMRGLEFVCPLDDPLWRLLPDPRGCVTAEPYDMLRIVDIASTLNGLPSGEGEVILRVRDACAPWNDGIWRFFAQNGALRAEMIDGRNAHRDIPEITINELTEWVFGCGGFSQQMRKLLPLTPVFLYDMY